MNTAFAVVAGLAGGDRGLEPGVGHRRRHPGPVRAPAVAGGYWIEDHTVVAAVLWPVAIMAVFLPLAVRAFQRLSH